MEHGAGRTPSLLAAASRRHAARGARQPVKATVDSRLRDRPPDLGDLVITLLASTLAGLRDRLSSDGFEDAATLVADLVEATDDYLAGAIQ